MSLLDLVEQDHRIRPAADGFGEPSTFLVADVAGRSTDKPGNVVPLSVLAHVDPDDGRLGVEEELRQRLGQLGLAHARRAQEEERADRAVRVLQTGPAAADGVGDGVHGVILVHHPEMDLLLDEAASRARWRASARPGPRSTG